MCIRLPSKFTFCGHISMNKNSLNISFTNKGTAKCVNFREILYTFDFHQSKCHEASLEAKPEFAVNQDWPLKRVLDLCLKKKSNFMSFGPFGARLGDTP